MLPIETERLRLHLFEPRDAARLASYRSDESVARYQSWFEMTREEADAFIAEQPRLPAEHGQWIQIAIADKQTDDLIGDIGLCTHAPGTNAEIGFTLAPSAQGNGFATEACRAAIDLAFSREGVEVVEAVVDARNLTAIALVKRLGMSLDRTESAEFKGEVCAENHYVLLGVRWRGGLGGGEPPLW